MTNKEEGGDSVEDCWKDWIGEGGDKRERESYVQMMGGLFA